MRLILLTCVLQEESDEAATFNCKCFEVFGSNQPRRGNTGKQWNSFFLFFCCSYGIESSLNIFIHMCVNVSI